MDWLFGLFGYVRVNSPHPHKCEEFTRWEPCKALVQLVSPSGENIGTPIARYWQERACTLCGKIQQESLPYEGGTWDIDDEDDEE